MQDQNRKFYEDFGARIQFLRNKREMTLAALAGGTSSTAKSWEAGSRPRPEQWEAIAKRLNLSVSFVFLGQPKSREDFGFVAKFADEIGRPSSGQLEEEAAIYDTTPADTTPEGMRREAKRILAETLTEAGDDIVILGWIVRQLRLHIAAKGATEGEISEEAKSIIEHIRRDGAARRAAAAAAVEAAEKQRAS